MSPPKGSSSREAILRAAAELAIEHGYDGATIARVTERSGLPASSVYWHFADKDELLAEVLRHSFDEFLRDLPRLEPLTGPAALAEGMRKALDPALRGLLAGPGFLRLGLMLTMEKRLADTRAHQVYTELRERLRSGLEEWFAESLRAVRPAAAPDLAGDLARVVLTFADGLSIVSRAEVTVDVERYADTLLAVLEHAMRTSGTAAAASPPA